MEENTTKLIEQLAQKLGTTTEYLWGVLIKQAKIAAFTAMVWWVFAVALGIVMVKLHVYFSDPANIMNYFHNNASGVTTVVLMCIGCVVEIVLIISAISEVEGIVNGLLHPEFWALDYVMSQID